MCHLLCGQFQGRLLALGTDTYSRAWSSASSTSYRNAGGDRVVATELPAYRMGKQSRHHTFDFSLGSISDLGCQQPPLDFYRLDLVQLHISPAGHNPILCVHTVGVLRGESLA